MHQREVAIKIGGEAGFGIKVAGLILARTCFNAGLYVFGYSEYPSLIRGGHNTYQLNIADEKVKSATKKIDILVALNQETIDLHKDELNLDGVVIHNNLNIKHVKHIKNINFLNISLNELAKKAGAEITKNVVALGAVMGILKMDLKLFNKQLEKEFGGKGEKVVAINKRAAKLG